MPSGGEKPPIGFKSFKVAPSNFKIWRGEGIDPQTLSRQLDVFVDPLLENRNPLDLVYELMLKSGRLLTEPIVFDQGFYRINGGELVVILNKIDEQVLNAALGVHPRKIIILDNLFSGNDQLKTNIILQLKDAGIDLTTI